jgi:CHAD domain-containing protein
MSHPVATLHKQTVALRAAIIACLAKPKPKPVHTLRTTARRIQAQLELIPLLTNAPKVAPESRRAMKAVKPIRQAAGEVRDLDVHADHLAELPQTTDSEALARVLSQKRDREAEKLQRILHKRQGKMLAAIDDLEAALVPAHNLQLSPARASQFARRWFADSTSHLNPRDPAQFHELRKAAKLARYIAEAANAPSPTARRFNRIQQATGEWHDWLTLTIFARKHLARSSPLLTILKQRCDHTHHTALMLASTIKPPRKTRSKA